MKKFVALIIIILTTVSLYFCSGGQSAKEQIQIETKSLSNPLYRQAYRLYYTKQYKQGYELLSNYVFNQKGKSLVLHSLLVKFAIKLKMTGDLSKKYLDLKEHKYSIFANGVMSALEGHGINHTVITFQDLLKKRFPGNPVILMYMGYLYILRNNPHFAVVTLEKSVSALSAFPFNRYYLAMAHYHTKNISAAVSSLDSAIALFPSFMQREIEAAQRMKKRISR